jgi:hypothetical protein
MVIPSRGNTSSLEKTGLGVPLAPSELPADGVRWVCAVGGPGGVQCGRGLAEVAVFGWFNAWVWGPFATSARGFGHIRFPKRSVAARVPCGGAPAAALPLPTNAPGNAAHGRTSAGRHHTV